MMAVAVMACGHRGPDAARPGSERMELLDGRLSFAAPAGAKASPYRASIMAAEESSAEETRVLLVPGSGEYARFVLQASELFATVDDDAARRRPAIEAWVGGTMRFGDVRLSDGATAVEYVTTQPVGDGPVLVYGAVIPMKDGTAVELDYYILPDDADERGAWVDSARALTRSVVRGDRPLVLAARTVTIEGLAIDVPDGTALTAQPGPDFAVYRLRRVGPLAATAATIGIYLGGWPSYQHMQSEVDGDQVTTVAGTLLGEPVEWHVWSSEGAAFREAIVRRGDHDAIHVYQVSSVGDPVAAELERAISTMRAVARE